jgi:DNA processing protein
LLLYQIGITLIPGIGDINAKKLISYCGSLEAVFSEKPKNLKKIPGIGESTVNSILSQNVLTRAEEELKFIEQNKIVPLFYLDKSYPQRLKHCDDSPVMLYYLGNIDLNADKIISVVGTRRATDYGKGICDSIIEGLKDQEVVVVSGLAYGIDTQAHKSALHHQMSTLGVLAHGLDRIYPYSNRSLAEKMLSQGGLITDFKSNTNPDRENFPKRNRVIAGLADAIVVIESAMKGGALITANIANSYNRDVFAVPGKIGDKLSEGCNFLIKTNKAALIQSAEDIKYIMRWETKKESSSRQKKIFMEFTPDEELIMKILEETRESSFDYFIQKLGLSSSKLATALLNLEFEGMIKTLPGKMYRLL